MAYICTHEHMRRATRNIINALSAMTPEELDAHNAKLLSVLKAEAKREESLREYRREQDAKWEADLARLRSHDDK